MIISMIRDLFHHQAWADAMVFKAIASRPGASDDETLRKTLHHTVMTQRAFLSLFLKRPFDVEKESRVPASFEEFEALFRETHREEIAFVDQLEEAQLTRIVELPPMPQLRPSVAEALMQVVMHSQAHRGQCTARLRALEGVPPTVDFLLWIKDRPTAVWTASSSSAAPS